MIQGTKPTSRRLAASLTALALLIGACSGTAAPTAAPATRTAAPATPTAAPATPTAAPATSAPATPTAAPATPTAAPATPTAAPATPTAAPSTPAAVVLPTPEKTTVRIGISNLEANGFLAKFAADEGLYAKYGITTVEVTYFEGAQRNLQAIIADQIDAASDAPQTTLTSLTTTDPLQDVVVYANGFLDCIVSGPTIKTAADLKGKRFAISQLGGQSHAEVLIALEAMKLTPADVNIVQIGGQGARVAALQAGSVDAIPVDCALSQELATSGMNILLRLPDVKIDFATANLSFKKSFIDQNPNTVLAVVAANLDAMQMLFSDEDKAVTSLVAWAQVSEADARSAIQGFKAIAHRNLVPTAQGYETVKNVLVTTNPEIASVDQSKAFTTSFLDKLKELGLNQQLGVPEQP
jgi:ABC-type nitrate/sulfonate/bicarbonate transport system substrate-binding protein